MQGVFGDTYFNHHRNKEFVLTKYKQKKNYLTLSQVNQLANKQL